MADWATADPDTAGASADEGSHVEDSQPVLKRPAAADAKVIHFRPTQSDKCGRHRNKNTFWKSQILPENVKKAIGGSNCTAMTRIINEAVLENPDGSVWLGLDSSVLKDRSLWHNCEFCEL